MIYRVYVFTQVYDASNALWTLIGPEGDSEAQSFGVELVDGVGSVVYGISSAFSEEMLLLLKSLQDNVSLIYYVCGIQTEQLIEQHNGSATVGDYLPWHDAIANAGLSYPVEDDNESS